MAARVRAMTRDDFPFAVALTDTERWGFTSADFERCLAIEPQGCFVVEHESERAGLLTTARYGPVAWLGNVIVSQRLRGQGLGAALLRHALEYLDRGGALAVRLWAYENTVELYKEFGFAEDKRTSRRWIGFGHVQHSTAPVAPPRGCTVFPLNPVTVRDLFAFDAQAFGGDRSRVLDRLAREAPGAAFVARAGFSRVAGYLLATVSPKGCEVGPWVVGPKEWGWAGPALLESVLHALEGQSIEMGVPDERADVQDILEAHGFHAGFKTHRMTRTRKGAAPPGGEEPSAVCAIGSLERG